MGVCLPVIKQLGLVKKKKEIKRDIESVSADEQIEHGQLIPRRLQLTNQGVAAHC